MTKTFTPVIVPETARDVEIQDRIDVLTQKIKQTYPTEFYLQLIDVCFELSNVGLPLREACVLNDVDYEKFLALMEKDPNLRQLIDKKILKFKRTLLKVVSTKAASDDKLALDMLIARFPEEFNRRKGVGGEEAAQNNVMNMAINFIQSNGDKAPLVAPGSGRAIEVEDQKTKDRKTIMERLSKLLN